MSRANTVVDYIKLLEFNFARDLIIVETGSIRNTNPDYISGDGHSTFLIAKYLSESNYSHIFYSLDLDISVAQKYIETKKLHAHVHFMQGDSISNLQRLPTPFDLVYLDSANNATHILNEFKVVERRMPRGIVIVDDVDMHSNELLKGHLVVPYAQSQGYNVDMLPRQALIWVKHD